MHCANVRWKPPRENDGLLQCVRQIQCHSVPITFHLDHGGQMTFTGSTHLFFVLSALYQGTLLKVLPQGNKRCGTPTPKPIDPIELVQFRTILSLLQLLTSGLCPNRSRF